MPRFTKEVLRNLFTYHAPTPEQITRYAAIREAGENLATVIAENVPEGADQADAIRSVRNAVMTANQGIATAPKYAILPT